MADMSFSPTLLTETDVSRQLSVSLAALRKWRVMNRGPLFVKIGSLVRYRQNDIDVWLASLPVGGGNHGRIHADQARQETSEANERCDPASMVGAAARFQT
jgi:hypothetical protein